VNTWSFNYCARSVATGGYIALLGREIKGDQAGHQESSEKMLNLFHKDWFLVNEKYKKQYMEFIGSPFRRI